MTDIILVSLGIFIIFLLYLLFKEVKTHQVTIRVLNYTNEVFNMSEIELQKVEEYVTKNDKYIREPKYKAELEKAISYKREYFQRNGDI